MLCFFNVMWFWRMEKQAPSNSWWRAIRGDKRGTIAHRCGTKHIHVQHLQLKMLKSPHVRLGTLLEVEVSKKCTRLCGVKHICIHLQGTMLKAPHALNTFGSQSQIVEKVHAATKTITTTTTKLQLQHCNHSHKYDHSSAHQWVRFAIHHCKLLPPPCAILP